MRSDRDLVELAQHGDRAAIGELFSRYWRAARAAAFGVTGEFASAEDAAAEAFGLALAGLHALRDPDRFGAWLRTIVVRQARLTARTREATLDAAADDRPDDGEPPDDALERREAEAMIRNAMCDLPESLREAMALFYVEGYDTDAAARFLDIPAGTLRRRLHDGRAQLRKAVDVILRGNNPMNGRRQRDLERIARLIEGDDLYRGMRASLALRPPPHELIDRLIRRRPSLPLDVNEALRIVNPSRRISDPNDPVGSVALAIRTALPQFATWPRDPDDALRFLTFTDDHRERVRLTLPPGFAEGRPGAFLRASRACLVLNDNGSVRSIYEHLQDSGDEQTFAAGLERVHISDVIDLVWMEPGALELRSIQEMLERLSAAIMIGAQARFSAYDEPRYRSALQLHVGDVPARAASGGVLAEWPGRPSGVDAAHVRIFLEPWAASREEREARREKRVSPSARRLNRRRAGCP